VEQATEALSYRDAVEVGQLALLFVTTVTVRSLLN
jgi:hypothetical protein